jgi:type II secretory pathway pseudopilin PulG
MSPQITTPVWAGNRGLQFAVDRLRLSVGCFPAISRDTEPPTANSQPLTANCKPPTANRSGFVLWEMLLALGIFCMGAIALTSALQQAVDTVILIHDESEVRQDLESILAEATVNKLQPGKTAIFMGDHRIQYQREVVSLPAKNSKGQPVANLWQVTVRASWSARNRVRTSEAQEVLFQP